MKSKNLDFYDALNGIIDKISNRLQYVISRDTTCVEYLIHNNTP